jgi:hypothetical protein
MNLSVLWNLQLLKNHSHKFWEFWSYISLHLNINEVKGETPECPKTFLNILIINGMILFLIIYSINSFRPSLNSLEEMQKSVPFINSFGSSSYDSFINQEVAKEADQMKMTLKKRNILYSFSLSETS